MELVEDWGAKQGRILTGGGTLERFFQPGRDYRDPEDLPHHLLSQNASLGPTTCPNGTHAAFTGWKAEGLEAPWLAGAWSRPLFTGGFEESSEADTFVRNIQTATLFVDMRWPHQRDAALAATGHMPRPTSLQQCSDAQLRVLARQHVFSGFSLASACNYDAAAQPVVVRHHAIDWNYNGQFPRSRPNMWRVEMDGAFQSFKEWGVAVDDYGQACYMERWRKLDDVLRLGPMPEPSSNQKPNPSAKPKPIPKRYARCLALRRGTDRDAVLCIADGHFGLAVDRTRLQYERTPDLSGAKGGGMANLVDHALAIGDRGAAEEMLSIEGSYGTVNQGRFTVARSTHPWKEGRELFGPGTEVVVRRSSGIIEINGEPWEIFECNFCNRDLGRLFCRARFRVAVEQRAKL